MDTKEKNRIKNPTTDSPCPMVDFVNIVSGKWAIPVLYRLIITDGVIRFGALQRARKDTPKKSSGLRYVGSLESVRDLQRRVAAKLGSSFAKAAISTLTIIGHSRTLIM